MNETTIFCCPICRQGLKGHGRSYKCEQNHTFDLAREGYLNLILPNQKKSKEPGDSREMIVARKNFLNLGCYQKLAETVAELVNLHQKNSCPGSNYNLLDAGCGEGYYLDQIARCLSSNAPIRYSAVDVSKEGVREAAKRKNNFDLAVASVYDLPLADKSQDCLISVFAPTPSREFARVMQDKGVLIIVRPGANHLLALKEKLYSAAYLNTEDKLEMPDFIEYSRQKIEYSFTINGDENLLNLIKMTPYYHNTEQKRITELLSSQPTLTIQAEFIITVWQKQQTITCE